MGSTKPGSEPRQSDSTGLVPLITLLHCRHQDGVCHAGRWHTYPTLPLSQCLSIRARPVSLVSLCPPQCNTLHSPGPLQMPFLNQRSPGMPSLSLTLDPSGASDRGSLFCPVTSHRRMSPPPIPQLPDTKGSLSWLWESNVSIVLQVTGHPLYCYNCSVLFYCHCG